MKIVREDAVYVQLHDIAYLMRSDLPVPGFVYTKVMGDGEPFIVLDSNRFDFVKFDRQEEKDYFLELDWIIDYEEYNAYYKNSLIELGQQINESRTRIAKKFNMLSDAEKKENQDMVTRCELLEFKMYGVRDLLWQKQGHLKFNFPKGIGFDDTVSDEVDALEDKNLENNRFVKKLKLVIDKFRK